MLQTSPQIRRLTPSQSPTVFARTLLDVEPHPTQISFLEKRASIKTAACGRRWGKSFAEAIDLLWFACAFPNTTQFVVAPTGDQSRVIMEAINHVVLGSMIESEFQKAADGGVIRRTPFPECVVSNGSSIHARTAGQDTPEKAGMKTRGRGADRVVVDEAAYVANNVISSVIGPFMATSEYGELVLISTPFGRGNYFAEYFDRGRDGQPGFASFQFPTSDNPHVRPGYLESERRRMTSLEYRVEYLAEFVEDQNAVFPTTLIESCLGLADAPLGPDGVMDGDYVLGYDPAKYSDRSGVAVLCTSTTPWRLVHIDDISGRDYLTQAATIAALSRRFNDARILLDATSHDQMLEHLLKHEKVRAEGFRFTNESKNELINGLVLAMERQEVVLPHDPDLMTELKYYRYELTAAGNVKLGADSRHHDDLVTALALAVQRGRQGRRLPYSWMNGGEA